MSVGARALYDLIEKKISDNPRSLQVELGPSELGDPCDRRLAFKIAQVPKVPEMLPWRQFVGTAIDAQVVDGWLAERPEEWLPHTRVHVGDTVMYPIKGSFDAYHIPSQTLVDLKCSGPSTIKKARSEAKRGEANPQYRVQIHGYARGLVRAGYPVKKVALLRLPTAGELADAVFFEEDYDEQIVLDALKRIDFIQLMVLQHGDKAPSLLPAVEAYCHRCPWFRPMANDLAIGCPGAGAQEFDKTLGGLLPS